MNNDQKTERDALGFAERVKAAVIWRSGGQIVAQFITWAATFIVIRLLQPTDYGLFAMAQVVLVFLNLMNGYGFANALVQSESVDRRKIAQVFGMLILLNGGLALGQIAMAPVAASYFRQPMVADLLTVQALLYLFTPFIAIPNALLSREIDFSRQAKVNLLAAVLSAAAALFCAMLGFGVWTLVIAPLVLFGARAVGLTLALPWLVPPSFRFEGAGTMFRYGGAMVLVQFFWFVQSQSDVFIAGRSVSPHDLGIYTTALFLTQIVAAKFVPPLNEVAFAAYSRIQTRPGGLASSFLKAVRLIMLLTLPFHFGLAATAEPLILTMLGEQWVEAVPLVRILALAMPFMTLQILFGPATNALGRAGIALRVSVAGALIMSASFFIGIQFGTEGLAFAWLAGFPLLTAITAAFSLPVIGVTAGALLRAVMPGLATSAAMLAAVLCLDALLPPLPAQARLLILVSSGAAAYGALLMLFARNVVAELLALARRRPPAAA
ncbi:MAG: lipopolysaccharide biosynthesis protein [Pseudomonadota bacterium]|nr:lipopolysaccharide biosynthesis protein [Pseudomonadota bacterium]